MLLIIDNYDSFTFNLAHLVGAAGETFEVARNDALSVEGAMASEAEAFILSPGPGAPADAGICVPLVRAAAQAGRAVFGVCLGLQAIAEAFGGRVARASTLMHGKTCTVRHEGGWLYEGAPPTFTATRYHSLIVDRDAAPHALIIDAEAEDSGAVMSARHRELPIAGVQFHPESIASEYGDLLIANFMRRARAAA